MGKGYGVTVGKCAGQVNFVAWNYGGRPTQKLAGKLAWSTQIELERVGNEQSGDKDMKWIGMLVAALCLALAPAAGASIAYGSLNNFDCVNDTGQECHGFEIELEDIRCRDITYTYDWNHYGPPRITEDLSDPAHPRCIIRHESGKKPDGSWSAYTAVPSGPIAPTDGHMFTDPSVNFGGEHFGVGFYGAPTAVRYNWLVDDGFGNLVHGGVVNISTPVFSYYPPVGAQPAVVQAVVAPPPPPPAAPILEFGDAMWVKVTTTESHNNHKVELRDLVSDDPEDPNDENWKNGEPDEVEVEWQLMQTEFNQVDGGKNGEQVGAPEELRDGDEVITRRYDFYKYAGPLDPETGEAKCDNVGPDDIHGDGVKVDEEGNVVDYSTVVVVGDYIGAQMAGFDVEGKIGLIDHLQDGVLDEPYIERRVVVGGTPPINTTVTGVVPAGMSLDLISGILSGVPTAPGVHNFTVHSVDSAGGDVTMAYSLNIVAPGAGEGEGEGQVVLDPHDLLTPYATLAALLGDAGNDMDGNNVCDMEQLGCLQNVLETGEAPAVADAYLANRDRAAADLGPDLLYLVPGLDSLTAAWTMLGLDAWVSQLLSGSAPYDAGNYDTSQNAAVAAIEAACDVPACGVILPAFTVGTSASPVEGGITTGDGAYHEGDSVTVGAVPNPGFSYLNWTVGNAVVSADALYSFTVSEDVALVANFARNQYTITASAAPAEGGSVSGGGAVSHGDSVTVNAVANAGYTFDNWSENGAVVSASASYSFTAESNRDLVANFTRVTYMIAVSAAPASYGSASGGGAAGQGDSVTVVAAPNPGYRFVKWVEGTTTVSTSPAYTFTAEANRTLVARFAVLTYNVTVKSSPLAGGSATGGGTKLAPGSSVTVVATPNVGYVFNGWVSGGVVVSMEPSYTFTVNANTAITARFLLVTYRITTTPSPSAGGTATGGNTKALPGSTITAIATANAGYGFAGWLEGGVLVSASETYVFTADRARALVAKFVVLPALRALAVLGPVTGGNETTGTVTLSSVAPLSGTTVALASADPALVSVPAAVTVAPGQKTATFTATTAPVAPSKLVAVSATLGSVTKTVNVRVQ
jgi:hypothetical protein